MNNINIEVIDSEIKDCKIIIPWKSLYFEVYINKMQNLLANFPGN